MISLKYGTTQMEVDADGSLSYPEPIARDNGKCLFLSSSSYYEVLSLINTKHTMWYFDCLCQLTSILVQNLLALKKNNSCGCFMRTNFEKFVVRSTFLIKFRYLLVVTVFKRTVLFRNKNEVIKWLLFNRFASVSVSCFAGNSSNLFQKVLPAMVSHGTSSEAYNVWLFYISFRYML